MTSMPKPSSSSSSTASSVTPDRMQKASTHYRLAMNYQTIAKRMKDRHTRTGETAYQCLAGEAAYSAAKRCINAVANLDGSDPQGNAEKKQELDRIQHAFPQYSDLKNFSISAWNLHIHADQTNMTEPHWQLPYQQTDELINALLEIYRSKTNPVQATQ